MSRIPIRFGRLEFLFLIVGLTPGRSYIELEPDVVRVRMGWAFSMELPRVSIRSAQRAKDSPWSIGVHGWGQRWRVNGAASPMVAIDIAPPASARVLFFRVSVRELLVSVDDPDALVLQLREP
jgi:hypothetical protein